MEGMSSLTVINVHANNWDNPDAPKLDDEAIALFEAMEGVKRVVAEENISAYLEKDKYRTMWQMNLSAMNPDELYDLGYTADIGEALPDADTNYIMLGEGYLTEFARKGKRRGGMMNNQAVVEISPGDTLEINLGELDWEDGKPMTDEDGKAVKVPKLTKVTVVGLYGQQSEHYYSAFISRPLYDQLQEDQKDYQEKLYGKEETNNRYQDPNKYNSIQVKVTDEDDVMTIQTAINDMGFRAYSPMEYLEEMQKVSGSIQVILGGIGAISLFIAAIGITNTMMMSIYERTKEIGVMKVIGAKLTDIRKMFLVEALMIGAIGGGIGVILSYSLSMVMNKFGAGFTSNLGMGGGDMVSEIPLWLAVAALAFSTVIGLVAGYFPARRAMKLSALSAIRTE